MSKDIFLWVTRDKEYGNNYMIHTEEPEFDKSYEWASELGVYVCADTIEHLLEINFKGGKRSIRKLKITRV